MTASNDPTPVEKLAAAIMDAQYGTRRSAWTPEPHLDMVRTDPAYVLCAKPLKLAQQLIDAGYGWAEAPAPEPTEEEWSERVQAARSRARAKGYDDVHDRTHGPVHLLLWAQDYLRRGRLDDAGGLIDTALGLIMRLQVRNPSAAADPYASTPERVETMARVVKPSSYPLENHADLVLAAELGYHYASKVLAGETVGPAVDILPVRPFTRVGPYVVVRELVVDRRGRRRWIGDRPAIRVRLILAPPVLADHLEMESVEGGASHAV